MPNSESPTPNKMNSSTLKSQEFKSHFSETLSDYVTDLAWSPDGETLAVTTSNGEVILWRNNELVNLQIGSGKSVDCLAFSHDGQFLAVGGQDGKVKVWRNTQLIATLENAPLWIDKLSWSPVNNHLAYGLGRDLQVWNPDTGETIAKLNFANSSVLGIDWSCDGKYLAASGHRGIKVWDYQNPSEEPYIFDIPSATIAMGWSPDGKYIASCNMGNTLTVVETGLLLSRQDPDPWVMRGFPGKVRQLTWSQGTNEVSAPLLATVSVDGIIVWEKSADESVGWESRVLTNHLDIVRTVSFAPQSFLLASAGADGWLCLWEEAQQVSQLITDVSSGFSCIAWHPSATQIAAGTETGELRIWKK